MRQPRRCQCQATAPTEGPRGDREATGGATLEDAIERLVILAKIERGSLELDAGQSIDHSEAKRRLLR